MLVYLGLQNTPPEMLYFVASLAFTASFAFGFATDAIMRRFGFGLVGNALIGAVGAVIGARVWLDKAGHGTVRGAELASLFLCAALAGTLLLLLTALLKRAVARV
jgi:uncharacterized membrane protein YeaQ/YmgE (transglycosylase-associated protein family)